MLTKEHLDDFEQRTKLRYGLSWQETEALINFALKAQACLRQLADADYHDIVTELALDALGEPES